jgi:integrase
MRRDTHGSVYQRQSDGRWCAAYIDPATGRRIVRYAPTEAAARQLLGHLQAQAAAGGLAPPARVTLAAWLARWLTDHAPAWRPRTQQAQAHRARLLGARLGRLPLARLTPLAIETALGGIAREHGSHAAQTCYTALRQALADAVRLGLLGANPCDRVRRPVHRPRPRRWLTAQELRRLVAHLRTSTDPDAPAVLLLVALGLRAGELLGLRWGDVDLATGVVHVRRTRGRLGGAWLEHEPKTPSGARTVPLVPLAREALGRLPRGLDAAARVLPDPASGLADANWLRRAVRRLCRRASVPVQTPHGLRHAALSAALAAGAPLAEVARWAGHATPAVTARVYAHALGQPDRVARALEQALQAEP